MNQMEQRIMSLHERDHILHQPNQGMATIIGCEPNSQEDDSVYPTPGNSPVYSHDGNGYPTADMGYFSAAHSPPTSSMAVAAAAHSLQRLPQPPVSPNGTYQVTPGSPCDDFCGSSPYSPPYDLSSPHSITCSSTSPHGSPISCSDVNNDYSPCYVMAPDSTIHDLPMTSLAMSSPNSLPYAADSDSLIYTGNVPTSSTSGYYSEVMPAGHSHWIETGLPDFNGYHENPHSIHQQQHLPYIMQGEVLINIIEQTGPGVEGEMMPPPPPHHISYYQDGSPIPSPDSQNSMFCPELAAMQMHEMACPSYPHKQPKTRKPKKAKPVIQVNDEHIKDIPTSAQLWEFTLRVLKKPAYHYMINWENKKEGLFRFHDAPAFAALWGKHRNRPNMTYDKVARALRYYYKRDILNQVGGRLTYRFSKRLGKLYAVEE